MLQTMRFDKHIIILYTRYFNTQLNLVKDILFANQGLITLLTNI